eukprot:PRCOL_00004607-RA
MEDGWSPYTNEGGHSHITGGDLDAIAAAPADKRVLKVSSGSNPKNVAGSIAYVTRAGEPPALLGLGASCINQAVKATAIARGYLQDDGVDIALQPSFRDQEQNSLSLTLVKRTGEYCTEVPGEKELTVSSSSAPTSVAGAIAGKVREGERCSVVGIGAECVNKAVLAITFARQYLKDNAVDIKSVPHFVKVTRQNGDEVTAMKFTVLAEQC